MRGTNGVTVRIQMSCCHLAVMKKFLCGRPAQFDWLVATYHISQGREYRPDPDRERGGIELSGSHVFSPDLKKINQSAV